MLLRRALAHCLLIAMALFVAFAPQAVRAEAMGIGLEGFPYPYPVHFMPITLEGEDLRLAYMDVAARRAIEWADSRPSAWPQFPVELLGTHHQGADRGRLSGRGPGPDRLRQVVQAHFRLQFRRHGARHHRALDSLHVDRFDLVGHSMGGMLAVRLARAYGSRIDHLVLYSPIGLEDYRLYAPPVTDEMLANNERALTADGYRKQLMTNYALSLPSSAIEPFVQLREQIKESGEYPRWLKSFVASYQMIYSQPVAHEIPLIDRPTLFIMGANDHNAPGRPFAPPELRAKMGKNAELAQALAARMANAKVKVFEGVGHLGHLEATQPFNETLLSFLAQ